jgi:DNA polymerase-3 subunit delta
MPAKGEPKRPRAYLLWGSEELRKREALARLLDELVPSEDRELDVQYVDATNAGVTGDSLLHAVRDRAMFSERRVVVVLNAGRLRGPRHQRTQEVLANGIATLPDYSTLILIAYADDSEDRRGRAPFGEALMGALKAHGKVQQFPQLKPEELAELATREARDGGKQLTPPAARMLAERAGPDSQQVLQETRKLISYVGDRAQIAPRDVEVMISAPVEDKPFLVLDAVMEGDRRRALRLLSELRESGMAVPAIMSMLAKALRNVAQAKMLGERGVSRKADAAEVPEHLLAMLPKEASIFKTTKPGYGREKLFQQGAGFTWDQLHRALDRLAVTEAGTKGWEYGAEDQDLALELFVASLCDAPRGEPRRSASGWSPRR